MKKADLIGKYEGKRSDKNCKYCYWMMNRRYCGRGRELIKLPQPMICNDHVFNSNLDKIYDEILTDLNNLEGE